MSRREERTILFAIKVWCEFTFCEPAAGGTAARAEPDAASRLPGEHFSYPRRHSRPSKPTVKRPCGCAKSFNYDFSNLIEIEIEIEIENQESFITAFSNAENRDLCARVAARTSRSSCAPGAIASGGHRPAGCLLMIWCVALTSLPTQPPTACARHRTHYLLLLSRLPCVRDLAEGHCKRNRRS